MGRIAETYYSKIKERKIKLEDVPIKKLWEELDNAHKELDKYKKGESPNDIIKKIKKIIETYDKVEIKEEGE
ncbi:hypothetical protein [Bacteroides sp. BFG-606]|uniref:hypothetical protein n=1 Tax=Bacteroides sp. BFG-606 TaxID=2972763 RepID=UPI002165EDB2|nr:hypothetical protein [Bacteroides sp. BFG-606]MCS2337527.1 hypothetical protein [Bacteroides sp. BFG-606]